MTKNNYVVSIYRISKAHHTVYSLVYSGKLLFVFLAPDVYPICEMDQKNGINDQKTGFQAIMELIRS